MSGLISKEWDPLYLEKTAGSEAYTKWLDGEFAANWGTWRFFTGHTKMRFFVGSSDEWELEGMFPMINYASEGAEFLQREFDRLPVL